MAKYDVEYRCGHKGTVQLVGKTSERERKLAWLATVDCPKCAAAKKLEAAQADETPVTIGYFIPAGNVIGKDFRFVAVASGGTYREKDNLKALGFSFGELGIDTGLFSYLSVKRREKAWHRIIPIKIEDFADNAALLKALGVVDGKLGAYSVEWKFSPVDLEMLRRGVEKAKADNAAAKEKAEKIGTSPLKEFADEHGSRWNGKLYGNEKYGWKIYVDNKEIKVPADVNNAYGAWLKNKAVVEVALGKTKHE